MDKDQIRMIVDNLLNERDLRMDDLFNQLQQVTRDLEIGKAFTGERMNNLNKNNRQNEACQTILV